MTISSPSTSSRSISQTVMHLFLADLFSAYDLACFLSFKIIFQTGFRNLHHWEQPICRRKSPVSGKLLKNQRHSVARHSAGWTGILSAENKLFSTKYHIFISSNFICFKSLIYIRYSKSWKQHGRNGHLKFFHKFWFKNINIKLVAHTSIASEIILSIAPFRKLTWHIVNLTIFTQIEEKNICTLFHYIFIY